MMQGAVGAPEAWSSPAELVAEVPGRSDAVPVCAVQGVLSASSAEHRLRAVQEVTVDGHLPPVDGLQAGGQPVPVGVSGRSVGGAGGGESHSPVCGMGERKAA